MSVRQPPDPQPSDEALAWLFEDLEQRAEALHLAERDAEVVEQAQAEYAAVTLAARLHASIGFDVEVGVVGLGPLFGCVRRVGPDWFGLQGGRGRTLDGATASWFVRTAAVRSAKGLSPQAVNEVARPVTARLSIGSVLRGLAGRRSPVVVHQLDGGRNDGIIGRVGADFVELSTADRRLGGATELLPLRWVAAICCE